MSARQLIVWESPYDGLTLKSNGFNLHIARYVIRGDGSRDCNLIWQCKPIGTRRRTINWVPKYGLSWTYSVPNVGSRTPISADGPWQMFDQSEAFDIFPNGTWRVSSSTGRAGWLKIGRNEFHPSKGRQMHVLIGLWETDSRSFTPIYVDPSPLAFGVSAEYQSHESTQIWYEQNAVPQTRISGAGLPTGQVDLSKRDLATGRHYASATYIVQDAEWQYSAEPPPPATPTGLLGGAQPGPSERVRRATIRLAHG